MNSRLTQKPTVQTKLSISLRLKVAIGIGLLVIVAGVIILIVLNTGNSTKTNAANNIVAAPSSNNAYFDGTVDSYIDFGKGKNLQCIKDLPSSNRMSITMWVKWGSFSNPGITNWANLFTLSDSIGSGDGGVFWVQHNQTNTRFEFALNTVGGSRQFIQSTTPIVAGTWYHLACVYDGRPSVKKMYIYVNGVLEATGNNASGNIAAFSNAAKLNMGRWSNPQNEYRRFNGFIDEVSIWNIALSQTQINNLINNPSSVLGGAYDAGGLIGYWNFDDLTANSLCGCHNNGTMGAGVTLPVELISFTAENKGKSVELNWVTASEKNNNFFLVERSSDMESFSSIGTVQGAGNSNERLEYSFVDENPGTSINYYRLKQTDYDGAFEYSKVISVNSDNKKVDLGTLAVGPNPFTDQIVFSYDALVEGQVDMMLYDLSGKVLRDETTEVTIGKNTLTLSGNANLPSGYYLACIRQNSVNTAMIKLAKAK